MTESFASLCVLSFERPGFLQACLETVRDAGAPFELIVHDDGSQQSAVKNILGRYLDEGIISHLMMNPPGRNEGVGEAVRKTFSVGQGDLLVKIDQDLVFEPGWLGRVREMFRDPCVGCVGLFEYHQDPVDINKMLLPPGAQPPHNHRYVEDFVGSAFAIPSRLYRVLGPIDAHSPAFSEDVGLKQRVKEAGEGGLKYRLALPDEDLAVNVGFGVGPSTVNLEFDEDVDGGVRIQSIRKGPSLFSGVPGESLHSE